MLTDTWQVDVEFSTHDLLKEGVVAKAFCRFGDPSCRTCDTGVRVTLPADKARTDTEAKIWAAQFVHDAYGFMPTSTTLVSWPVP